MRTLKAVQLGIFFWLIVPTICYADSNDMSKDDPVSGHHPSSEEAVGYELFIDGSDNFRVGPR